MKSTTNLLALSLASTLLMPSIGISAQKAPKKVAPEKKNIIFIIADDMRLDMAGFGGSKGSTPNLDAFKKESVEFANACTTTGLCSPSRAALFTGRYGHRTGIDDNLHLWHSRLMTLAPEHTTIYEWARDKSYFMGYYGKWHLGYITPDMRGVEEYGGNEAEKRLSKPKRPDFEGLQRYYDKTKSFEEKPEYYATSKVKYETSEPKSQVDQGIKFLEKVKDLDRPFFLTVSFHTPHPAYIVPVPWNKMYDYRKVELPVSIGGEKDKPEYQKTSCGHGWISGI